LDANLCTGEHCDGNGACVNHPPYDVVCQNPVPPCEGGQHCNPANGQCVNDPDAPLSTPCEVEGNLCTIDHCNGIGACVKYDDVDCQPAVPPCEGGQHCNPTNGQCVNDPDAPLSTPCEKDADVCTKDHCNGNGQCVYLSNICGACCFDDGSCTNGLTQVACEAAGGEFNGLGSTCLGDHNGDGKDDLCGAIPTVSEWGLAALTLLLLAGGKVYFGRRRNAVDAARD
jgi:hypothetical protein